MSFIDKDIKMEINYIKSQGVHTYTVHRLHRRSQRIPGIVFLKQYHSGNFILFAM